MLPFIDDWLNGLELTFAPLIPWDSPWLWLAGFAGLALLLLLPPTLRLLRGVIWRWLAALTVLVTLANPVVQRELREPLSTIVLLFEDASPSMRIGARTVDAKRTTDQLVEELTALSDPERPLDIRRIRFAEGRSETGSQLLAPLSSTLGQTPNGQIGGVFVVSDGQVSDAPADGSPPLPDGVPLNGIIVGKDPALADRRLTILSAPRFGLVGEAVTARVRVDDSAALAERARIMIRRDGQLIRRFSLPIGVDQSILLTPETSGRNLFEIEVEGLPTAEVTQINNRAAFVVNGVRERLRVLLVSGQPHQAERAWRNLLKSDPAVDLVHFTILRPADRRDATPVEELSLIAFPVRELFLETLDEFDLVIFDQYPRRGILPSAYFSNIVNYVREGGAVFVASGPSYASPATIYASPLRDILPAVPTGVVRTEPFKPNLTELGSRHPVTNNLEGRNIEENAPSWGRWHRLIEAQARRGDVLIEGSGDRPLLLLDRVGDGRIVQLLSDNLWLWARGYEGGGPHAELLRRAAHWAMFEPELEEERLVANSSGSTITIERRSLGDPLDRVTVQDPTGIQTVVALVDQGDGRATGKLAVGADGVYSVDDGERTTRVPIGKLNPAEFRDPLATTEILSPLSAATGGWIGGAVDRPAVKLIRSAPTPNQGPTVVDRRAYRVLGLSSFSLLPAWLGLLLTVGLSLLAWWREGR